MIDKEALTKEQKEKLGRLKKVRYDAENQSKLGYCLICNKPLKDYCNSHTVPQFVLRRIAVDGMLMTSVTKLDISPIDEEVTGIKKTGTIKRLCPECDNTVFKDYEKPDKLMAKPTDIILNSIALKIALYNYDKKLIENGLLEYADSAGIDMPVKQHHDADKKEDRKVLIRLIKAVQGKTNLHNALVFWCNLNYVVPIACQISVCLYGDLEGHIVNNVFDEDARHRMQPLYIVVFPLVNSSIIMLYHDVNDTNYHSFDIQFNKLSMQEQLEVINYLILLNSEDYFLSPKLKTILNDSSNQDVANLHEIAQDLHFVLDSADKKKDKEKLKNRKRILNLLDPLYAVH